MCFEDARDTLLWFYIESETDNVRILLKGR